MLVIRHETRLIAGRDMMAAVQIPLWPFPLFLPCERRVRVGLLQGRTTLGSPSCDSPCGKFYGIGLLVRREDVIGHVLLV